VEETERLVEEVWELTLLIGGISAGKNGIKYCRHYGLQTCGPCTDAAWSEAEKVDFA
jgi:hypothetical protein